MCTVTVHRAEHTLLVTMNRDESRERAPEVPPAPQRGGPGAVPWIGPRDGERGGTWIGVNAYGVVACLLNGNVPFEECLRAVEAGAPSRGAIIPAALAQGGMDALLDWIAGGFDPSPYPAFMLVVASPASACIVKWWGKGSLEETPLPAPWALVSSTHWNIDYVLSRREAAFQAWCESGCPFTGALPAYHLLRSDDDSTWAPLMDRGFSSTRSITQVAVQSSPPALTMRYGPVENREMPTLTEYALAYSGSQ